MFDINVGNWTEIVKPNHMTYTQKKGNEKYNKFEQNKFIETSWIRF